MDTSKLVELGTLAGDTGKFGPKPDSFAQFLP